MALRDNTVTEQPVYLIRDASEASFASKNGYGPQILCDTGGNIYEPDYVISGLGNVLRYTQGREPDACHIIGEFPNRRSYVSFGSRYPDGAAVNSYEDVAREIAGKGIRGETKITAILESYGRFLEATSPKRHQGSGPAAPEGVEWFEVGAPQPRPS